MKQIGEGVALVSLVLQVVRQWMRRDVSRKLGVY